MISFATKAAYAEAVQRLYPYGFILDAYAEKRRPITIWCCKTFGQPARVGRLKMRPARWHQHNEPFRVNWITYHEAMHYRFRSISDWMVFRLNIPEDVAILSEIS